MKSNGRMAKTIIVTGASRGIGFSILEKFASKGYSIAFCSKNQSSVDKATKTLKEKYQTIDVFSESCDMSVKEEVQSFANKCIDKFGKIDVLVNNAGQYLPGFVSHDSEEDNLEYMLNINLMSAYWMGKKVIPNMKKNSQGHIFNICSIAGLQAYANGGSYSISKFALQGYTKTIREELKTEQIRVTGIYPGATLTDSWSGTDFPKDRFIQPEDIAETVWGAYNLSNSAVIEDLIIRPQLGDI